MADKKVTVRVLGNYRVVDGDKGYAGGEQVSVPEHVAQRWERRGWVERVTSSSKK
jgi:hypothetical protein